MLKRKYAIPFAELPSGPSKTRTLPYFTLKEFPNREGHNRFGFVISAKVEPRATRRHYIKRILHEAAQNFLKGSIDYLYILSVRGTRATGNDIRESFSHSILHT